MNIQYENLEIIPILLEEIKKIKKQLNNLDTFKPDLSKAINVYKYLNISKATLYNYIDNKTLIVNKHYVIKNSHKVFITDAIVEFKNEFTKYAKSKDTITNKANLFLEQIAS